MENSLCEFFFFFFFFVAHSIIPRCMFNRVINHDSKSFLTMADEGYAFVF